MAPFYSLLSGGASGGFGFAKFKQEFGSVQQFDVISSSAQTFNTPNKTKWLRVVAYGAGGGQGAEGQGTRSNRRSNGGPGGRIDAYIDLGIVAGAAQVYVGRPGGQGANPGGAGGGGWGLGPGGNGGNGSPQGQNGGGGGGGGGSSGVQAPQNSNARIYASGGGGGGGGRAGDGSGGGTGGTGNGAQPSGAGGGGGGRAPGSPAANGQSGTSGGGGGGGGGNGTSNPPAVGGGGGGGFCFGPGPGNFEWGVAYTNSYNPGRSGAPGNIGAQQNNGRVFVYYQS